MKNMASVAGVSMLLASVLFHAGASSAQDACPKAKAAQALEAGRKIGGWEDAYNYFKQFQPCDDGAAAEAVDNAVETLLLNKWAGLPEAARQASADAKYEKFLLRHVGEGFSEEGAAEIIKRCRAKCPAGAEKLCGALIDVLQE